AGGALLLLQGGGQADAEAGDDDLGEVALVDFGRIFGEGLALDDGFAEVVGGGRRDVADGGRGGRGVDGGAGFARRRRRRVLRGGRALFGGGGLGLGRGGRGGRQHAGADERSEAREADEARGAAEPARSERGAG